MPSTALTSFVLTVGDSQITVHSPIFMPSVKELLEMANRPTAKLRKDNEIYPLPDDARVTPDMRLSVM